MFAARKVSQSVLGAAAQRRAFSATASNASKVVVLGAAGGIGQPLSLLLKLNPRVSELGLYDVRMAPGVAADVGHINTKSTVVGYEAGEAGLAAALKGAQIVVIPAGVPRKPGMTRDDLFNTNASIVRDNLGRTFNSLSINDSSTAFSDCNSDRSGEFSSTSATSRQLLTSCATVNSDEMIEQLVSDLDSSCVDDQKLAAMELRLLAKNKPENRIKIAQAGAIRPLISLILSSDLQLQEYGVTAILNLSLCDENKELIASAGAIKPLVKALRIGNSTAKENAACALLRLSQVEENKVAIGRSGAVEMLVSLLETGNLRGKKDASTALYSLCSVKENKIRAVEAGIMKPLVELMADFGSNMVDKSGFVLSLLVSVAEARVAVVDEGGIPVLVEIVEVGSQRQKEIAAAILLKLCEDSSVYRTMVAREGAIPPLIALSQSGTSRAKQKAETLVELLRRPRSGNTAARTSDVSY